MRIYFLALKVALVLSPFWGFGTWMKWQTMKVGTIIPTGGFTGRNGSTVSFLIKTFCVIALLLLIELMEWWFIPSGVLMWLIGNWLATLVERKLYCNNSNMDIIFLAAKEHAKDMKTEDATELMLDVAPKWWLKLMPLSWQLELREKLLPLLMPCERSNTKNKT